MDDTNQKTKILAPNLSQAERALLFHTVNTPGWKVVLKIVSAACLDFQQDTFKVNLEKPDGERIVVERQRRARNVTEFSTLLIDSVHEHANSVRKAEITEDEKAEDSVAAMFGIHDVRKGKPADAIKNVFGIHPARPKKKEVK